MGSSRIFSFLSWVSVLLLLAACDSGSSTGGGQQSSPGPVEPAVISFKFGALDASMLGGSGSGSLAVGGASQPQAVTVTLSGQVLIVPQVGSQQTLDFNVQLDPATVQVVTLRNVDLQPGGYAFYILLNVNSPSNQYGGIANVLILSTQGGLNDVTLTLYPLVPFGDPIPSVQAFRNLATLNVTYNAAEVATYANPRLGITITYTASDGSSVSISRVFDINADAIDVQHPFIQLFLLSGDYHVDATFFDGAIVKDVAGDTDITLPPPGDSGGSSASVPLITATASTNYSLEPTTGTATFMFPIPDEVVDEVGGVGSDIGQRLLVHATVVGPENPLVEQNLSLNLVSDGSHYTGTLTVPGFVPGEITWSLTFTALNAPSGEIGYCTDTVADTRAGNDDDPNHETFHCDLVLLSRTDLASFPVAWVEVPVTDGDGNPLPGAVVTVFPLDAAGSYLLDADGHTISAPLGVTPASGTLGSFLAAGSYAFQAAVAGSEPSAPWSGSLGTTGVTVVALQVPFHPPDTTPPAAVTGFVAHAGDGLVSLTWSNPAADFDHAEIYRLGTPDVRLDLTSASTAVDRGLTNGVTYSYAAYAVDVFGNFSPAQFASATPTGVASATIQLSPSRTTRPTVRSDDSYDATAPIQVRIPPLFKPAGSEGNPDVPGLDVLSGNPDRFLVMLKLGRVTCVYLGGKLDRAIEGIPVEDYWREAFKSPLCSNHKRAGDVVTIQPYGTGDDGDEPQGRPEIGARVLVGDPREPLTEIRVTIEVLP